MKNDAVGRLSFREKTSVAGRRTTLFANESSLGLILKTVRRPWDSPDDPWPLSTSTSSRQKGGVPVREPQVGCRCPRLQPLDLASDEIPGEIPGVSEAPWLRNSDRSRGATALRLDDGLKPRWSNHPRHPIWLRLQKRWHVWRTLEGLAHMHHATFAASKRAIPKVTSLSRPHFPSHSGAGQSPNAGVLRSDAKPQFQPSLRETWPRQNRRCQTLRRSRRGPNKPANPSIASRVSKPPVLLTKVSSITGTALPAESVATSSSSSTVLVSVPTLIG